MSSSAPALYITHNQKNSGYGAFILNVHFISGDFLAASSSILLYNHVQVSYRIEDCSVYKPNQSFKSYLTWGEPEG